MEPENKKPDFKNLIVFVPHNENLKFGVLSYIADNFNVIDSKVTVLETNVDDEDGHESRYVIAFKVQSDYNFTHRFTVTVTEKPFVFRAMQMHAKARNKVFYTLNAMNELIFLETGDRDNRTHQLDWQKYDQKIIYLVSRENDKELKIIGTHLVGVVNLDPIYGDEDLQK
jgi:hypothetical protein